MYRFLSHPALLNHNYRAHPENAERLVAILLAFQQSPHKALLDLTSERLASMDELALVHDRAYIEHVLSQEGKESWIDSETPITPGTVHAARLAVGIGLELLGGVLAGNIRDGFALVRPPGHHARPSIGMGFCIFNNIAIAAKQALAQGIKRLLIFDWDVHHGNGTQEAFYSDERVLFIDIHQEGLFPIDTGFIEETGRGPGLGFTVNIPLPKSCCDADYLYVFEKVVTPMALSYQPELILVSAGFDAHESDPHGFMCLTTQGYHQLCHKTKKLAERVCNGKMLLFLEGGYDPFFLAQNVMTCIDALIHTRALDVDLHVDMQSSAEKLKPIINTIYDLHDSLIKKKPT